MRLFTLTSMALVLGSAIAFANNCGLQTTASGSHHMKLAQNNAGNTGVSPTGNVNTKMKGVGVPAAVGSSGVTGGPNSGKATGDAKGLGGPASTAPAPNVPATVGESGAAGGAKTNQ